MAAAARDGDWLTLTMPLGDMEYAESQILAFGENLEVISPAEFRERLARRAREMAGFYTRG